MRSFIISETYDKFNQERKITVCSSNGGVEAVFYSSPRGEKIEGLLRSDRGIYLLDGVDRLKAQVHNECSTNDLKRICEASKVEIQVETWDFRKEADEAIAIPLARTLYNVVYGVKYPVDEIDAMYQEYLIADRKGKRKLWWNLNGEYVWGLGVFLPVGLGLLVLFFWYICTH